MNSIRALVLSAFCALLLSISFVGRDAYAVPINLNDFFADPTVAIAADGYSAVLSEDPFFTPILLANDPGLGDPNVIVPGVGFQLMFDFDFSEGVADDDEFGAFVLDGATGLSVGAGFEIFIQNTSSGSVSFDLTSLVGQTLGLQFQLSALPGDAGLGSTLTLSNVRIEGAIGIPEPSSLTLAATWIGLIGVFGFGASTTRGKFDFG